MAVGAGLMTRPVIPESATVLKSAGANRQVGPESVGGRLILTGEALHFHPHPFNIQRTPWQTSLEHVTGARKGMAMFLGFLPLAPTGMVVMLDDGTSERFVVWRRTEWIAMIEDRIGAGRQD